MNEKTRNADKVLFGNQLKTLISIIAVLSYEVSWFKIQY
jgi:hypothetical protein